MIEAFKATLEEVKQADLLLNILDISQPNHANLHVAVMDVLRELESDEKPIITVLNKIDKLEDKSSMERFRKNISDTVAISAKTGENLSSLINKITAALSSLIIEIDVTISIKRMDLISRAHNEGQVYSVKYYNDRIHVRASLPKKLAGMFEKIKI